MLRVWSEIRPEKGSSRPFVHSHGWPAFLLPVMSKRFQICWAVALSRACAWKTKSGNGRRYRIEPQCLVLLMCVVHRLLEKLAWLIIQHTPQKSHEQIRLITKAKVEGALEEGISGKGKSLLEACAAEKSFKIISKRMWKKLYKCPFCPIGFTTSSSANTHEPTVNFMYVNCEKHLRSCMSNTRVMQLICGALRCVYLSLKINFSILLQTNMIKSFSFFSVFCHRT